MGRDENLTKQILQLIEENPYCSSSEIKINGFSSECIFMELAFIYKEHLIAAEEESGFGDTDFSLYCIHLTLKGLNYLKNGYETYFYHS